MSLEFRFTSGIHAAQAATPWDTARVGTSLIAQPTTRQGIFDAIDAALVAAGYTQHVQVASTRVVYESDGESTNENFGIEMERRFTSDRHLALDCSPKLDASNELDGRCDSADFNNDRNRWDIGLSDFTADMMIFVNKNFLHVFVQNVNHTSTAFSCAIGLMKRTNLVNQNLMLLAAAPTPGRNVVLDVTGFDPLVLGYKINDRIQLMEINKAQSRVAETTIITALTTTSVTVQKLSGTYTIGSIVGMHVAPLARAIMSDQQPVIQGTAARWTSPLMLGDIDLPLGDFAQDQAIADLTNRGLLLDRQWPTTHDDHTVVGAPFGTGSTPNQRSNRFTCRTLQVGDNNGSTVGQVPLWVLYPGNAALFPHDDHIADRMASPNEYVPTSYDAPFSGSSDIYLFGPVPV